MKASGKPAIRILIVAAALVFAGACAHNRAVPPVAADAKLVKIADGFTFTEGPAVDDNGVMYFSDVRKARIHKMTPDGKITVYRDDVPRPNGLGFDPDGNLIACDGGNGRIVSISPDGKLSVVADKYDEKRFNQPNDLWVDSEGGVYFSDPVYSQGKLYQDGRHVYYVSPDRTRVVRVVDDMTRPNGLCGGPDGRILYIADHGAGKTWKYVINADGTLGGRKLFAESGSDGLKVDERGNVYLVTDAIHIYDPSGREIGKIDVPVRPTNLCFYGPGDRQKLFITARTDVYSIQTETKGIRRKPRK